MQERFDGQENLIKTGHSVAFPSFLDQSSPYSIVQSEKGNCVILGSFKNWIISPHSSGI